MPFDPETVQAMAEMFAGQVCKKCGKPAERLSEGKWFCHQHYPRARVQIVQARTVRIRMVKNPKLVASSPMSRELKCWD